MSLRVVIIIAMLTIAVMATIFIGLVGVRSITTSVESEALARVNHDLDTITAYFNRELKTLSEQLKAHLAGADIEDLSKPGFRENLSQQLDFTVLNITDVSGNPIAGTYESNDVNVPVSTDPVLRKALQGETAYGTVLLDTRRLQTEGGTALKNAMTVYAPDENSKKKPATEKALFWWTACPVKNSKGRVEALVYGGIPLNYNYEIVDSLRDYVFTSKMYNSKPLGTVTIFLGPVRVATNVLGPAQKRAIGTTVSKQVQNAVLDNGDRYNGRAWVVDQWYLSAYDPIKDPDGKVIGMLYVGLLEKPYLNQRAKLILSFIGPVIGIVIIAAAVGWFVVSRITRPLARLDHAAERISQGHWDEAIKNGGTFTEIKGLTNAFNEMQQTLKQRDAQLRQTNNELAESNEKLTAANRNYMQMLGFVTHELKSPLAAMQTIIYNMLDGFAGEVPDHLKKYLVRIERNCEELQDMVKNYLDLSRAERGEMQANPADIDLYKDVIEPCVSQSKTLFDTRKMSLDVQSPDSVPAIADAELLRIAVSNYLTNAAKYGSEGGKAVISVQQHEDNIEVGVWNEGKGFTEEEGQKLFGKFSRLRNDTTKGVRGSGLGLFLCRQIIELHDGKTWAESEPGQWARFSMSIPRKNN